MLEEKIDENLTKSSRQPNGIALIPFLVFILFYVGLSVWCGDFYKVSMPIAFLVASAAAFLLNQKESLGEKMELYAHGMGSSNIMIMCMIFILAGAFAATAKATGAVGAAVVIFRHLIPDSFLLANFFIVSCFISIAIGTSCGTIAALVPIACGMLGAGMNCDPAILLGAVIGGAMFGDNMSIISDTTIAATRTQNVDMRAKFITNIKMVIPAAVVAIIIYLSIGKSADGIKTDLAPLTWKDILLVVPYIIVLAGAVMGMNVMALLFGGTVLFAILGIVVAGMSFWDVMGSMGGGTLSMAETLIVAILAGGLLHLISHNGGIGFILQFIEKMTHGKKGCEYGVALLVALVNLFTANNTVAIVVAGPIAKEMSDKYNCEPKRIASILDATSCVIQGLIPYGAQILIAVGLANGSDIKVPALSLVGTIYYPILLGISLIFWIGLHRSSK